jgi:hypothetical protein
MSNIMTMTQLNKKGDLDTDSEIIPIKKKELMSRLEGDEIRYKSCYDECIKHAINSKTSKEEAKTYKKVLEINELKYKEVKNENEILKNELSIYKSKTSKSAKEIENKKVHVKSTEDFNKDVEEGYNREKEKLEKIKKSIEERYLIK